ncbi:MAG: right-handed parallel beta-helix repeat-containing protein [Planctomycetes bacterium]|nr:right-handed parallel beta-helix repeat-containing protein [Planctomycetota bacterium]
MKFRITFPCSLGLALCIASPAAGAGTRYVNGALTTGNNDGSSWSDAYRDPDAVAVALAAAVPGDEIWVAAGTYVPTTTTTRTLSHALANGVALYGGFAGGETLREQRDPALHVTILSGDIGAAAVNTDNSYHVVDAAGMGASAILDGFTITLGHSESATPLAERFGGGLRCVGGAGPTIRNCRFVNNFAWGQGGGVYLELCAPVFTDCTFENNAAPAGGGAFCRTTSVTFERCTFSGGGAMDGAGLWISENFSPPGGPPRILNSLIVGNNGTFVGGILSGADTEIQNCTIAFNTNSSSTSTTAGIVANPGVTIVNCIVYYNGPLGGPHTSAHQLSGTSAVTYSLVEGGFAGTGNSGDNPRFASGEFRLTIGSPAIDAGDNTAVPAGSTLDLARRPRFSDEPAVPDTGIGSAPIVDIGAFEGAVPQLRAFCFGNGAGVPCPCGNDAPPMSGNGCANSTGNAGRLDAEGRATLTGDTLVLRGSSMTDGACLYFQGSTAIAAGRGAVFGDGLLCVSGNLVRLWTVANVGGASQVPPAGGPPVHTLGHVTLIGSVRYYQAWYRDAVAFCTADGWNLTNGIWVRWDW